MEKLHFDGFGINDAADPFKPRLATFSRSLLQDSKRAKSVGDLLEAAPAMLAALEAFMVIEWSKPQDATAFNLMLADQARAAIAQAKGEA